MSTITYNKDTTATEVCAQFAADIKGTTVVITGPSVGGIGFATAAAIAKQGPAKVILVGRGKKLAEARAELLAGAPGVDIVTVECDLASLASVSHAAEEIKASGGSIDYFIANAGVMDIPQRELTVDGFESQLAINYLSHFVLLHKLAPLVLASEKNSVVTLASYNMCGPVQWEDPSFATHTYDKKEAYGQSKTAMMLLARAVAIKYGASGVRAHSVHPGIIPSQLARHWTLEEKLEISKMFGGTFHDNGDVNYDAPVWKTLDQGAATTCRAAFDTTLSNGSYLVDSQVADDTAMDYAKDPALAEKLWGWTTDLLTKAGVSI